MDDDEKFLSMITLQMSTMRICTQILLMIMGDKYARKEWLEAFERVEREYNRLVEYFDNK